jgi:predicted DNA-binding transcriptional regulator AlpA
MPDPQLERKSSVLKRTGYTRSALARAIAEGHFPHPNRLPGTRTPVWDKSAVDAFILTITKEARNG